MGESELYLGTELDGSDRVHLEMDHLTTHAVCLGMTGSGKTGLGIVTLEELARRGVSLLVIDLKGDMVNLLLNFPSLAGEDFAPWLPPDAVEDDDRSKVAADQAEFWRKELDGSGLGPDDLRAVRDGVSWQLLTPGAGSAAPLDILPALGAPANARRPSPTTLAVQPFATNMPGEAMGFSIALGLSTPRSLNTCRT